MYSRATPAAPIRASRDVRAAAVCSAAKRTRRRSGRNADPGTIFVKSRAVGAPGSGSVTGRPVSRARIWNESVPSAPAALPAARIRSALPPGRLVTTRLGGDSVRTGLVNTLRRTSRRFTPAVVRLLKETVPVYSPAGKPFASVLGLTVTDPVAPGSSVPEEGTMSIQVCDAEAVHSTAPGLALLNANTGVDGANGPPG